MDMYWSPGAHDVAAEVLDAFLKGWPPDQLSEVRVPWQDNKRGVRQGSAARSDRES